MLCIGMERERESMKNESQSIRTMSVAASNYPKIVKALEARCRALFKGKILGNTPDTVHLNVRRLVVVSVEELLRLTKHDKDAKRKAILGTALVRMHKYLMSDISVEALYEKGGRLIQAAESATGGDPKVIAALLVAMRMG